jgi:hypothetical protein
VHGGGNSSLVLAPVRAAVRDRFGPAAQAVDDDINTLHGVPGARCLVGVSLTAWAAWEDIGQPQPYRVYRAVNDRMVRAERAVLLPAGLPSRPWYKYVILLRPVAPARLHTDGDGDNRHAIYAPAKYKGYGAVVFPALTEVGASVSFQSFCLLKPGFRRWRRRTGQEQSWHRRPSHRCSNVSPTRLLVYRAARRWQRNNRDICSSGIEQETFAYKNKKTTQTHTSGDCLKMRLPSLF